MDSSPQGTTRLVPLNSCFICRSRKVKCDKTLPECTKCRRLGVRCPGYEDTLGVGGSSASRRDLRPLVDHAYRASGLERRCTGACFGCKKAKTRCSKEAPSCARCLALDVECMYDSVSARGQNKRKLQQSRGAPAAVSPASPGTSPAFSLSPSEGVEIRGPSQAGTSAPVSIAGYQPEDGDEWLFRSELPTAAAQLRLVFDLYFSRVHPRRCLGFVYRPAWMQSLDQGTLLDDFGEALVLLVCALGARCLSRTTNHRLSQASFRHRAPVPGYKWAARAKEIVLATLMQSSLRNLMALSLLIEYCLQTGQFADAFQLLGNCYRSIRLMSLDSPIRYEPSRVDAGDVTRRESELRIVWSCYIADRVLSAGIQQNSSWLRPPRIPLPVPDGEFLSQMPSIASMPRNLDDFAAAAGAGCLSLRAHFVYLVSLRNKVLRMIRQNMALETLTSPQSPYLQLIYELDTWYAALPGPLLLTSRSIYALQEMKTLSSTMHLHLGYHGAIAGLTRVSLPGFTFPLATTMRRAPAAFISQSQSRCRYHADRISGIIEMALPHGMEPFDDQFCGVAAFEASKVQIIHSAIVQQGDQHAMEAAERCLRVNLTLIEMTSAGSRLLPIRVIIALLKQHSFTDLAQLITDKLGSRSPEERSSVDLNGSAEDSYLTAIAPFRIAREELQASNLASPTSVEGTLVSEKSPVSAPPVIATIVNPVSQPGAVDLATPGSEWEATQASYFSEREILTIPNLDIFGLPDSSIMSFINDGANYLTWDQPALGTWFDMTLGEESTEQLYSEVG